MTSTAVSVHDRPDPIELIDAVREYLDHPPPDAGRDRLHRRVASNVLTTVARQLAAAAEDEAVHRDRLAALGVRDNAALAALAAGMDEDDPRFPELVAALADWAEQKVRVSNPRYLETT
ncbi:DUF6285 domain-containing protein [Nocardioides caeni]|uniref:DUF6285 domain-containing protein n=1 Tax=Nocardioides caeni TaxID=574700 RepID=A0A4S8MZQ0_9ACTN|nr:DUF6285 domain-containing protein [Nocardioides caeni]THV08825.1 hypothetical protein E9934_18800 [Nocardioides caeni]